MLKRLLTTGLSVAGFFAMALPSSGADLTRPPAYKAPLAVPTYLPVNPWSGFYFGANAGYGWEDFGGDNAPTASASDWFFGGQLGYNWLAGSWLFGLEGDMQGNGAKVASGTGTCGAIACSITGSINAYGTARGRVGYAFGPTMIYATGGAAFVNSGGGLRTPAGATDGSSWNTGYTVGGGIEQMFWGRWSGKLEYLYMNAGGPSLTVGGVTRSIDNSANLVRAGLNYHF
jgi:outer membrane immunogenic protein